MTPYEVLLSRVAGADARRRPAGRRRRACGRVFARYELEAAAIGEITDGRSSAAAPAGELVCEVAGRALADDAPRYRDRGVARDPEPVDLEPLAGGAGERIGPARAAGVAERARPQADLAALRPHERHEHAGRAGARRRRAAAAEGDRRGALALAIDGPGPGAARRARPVPGRRIGRARGRAQRRLLGRDADRHHRLPELRLAGDRSRRVAARAARSTASPTRAGCSACRSCPATSASTTRRRTDRSCRRRSSARSACSTTDRARCRWRGATATSCGWSASWPTTPTRWRPPSWPGPRAARRAAVARPRGGRARRALLPRLAAERLIAARARRLGRRAGGGPGARRDRRRVRRPRRDRDLAADGRALRRAGRAGDRRLPARRRRSGCAARSLTRGCPARRIGVAGGERLEHRGRRRARRRPRWTRSTEAWRRPVLVLDPVGAGSDAPRLAARSAPTSMAATIGSSAIPRLDGDGARRRGARSLGPATTRARRPARR